MNKPINTSMTKKIRICDITIPGRSDPSDVDDIRASISQHGQLNPIVITDRNVLVDGFRRIEALLSLQRSTVLAQVVPLERLEKKLIDIDQRLVTSLDQEESRRLIALRDRITRALPPPNMRAPTPRNPPKRNGFKRKPVAQKAEPLFDEQEARGKVGKLSDGYTFEWFKVSDLTINKEYQRTLSPTRAKRIAEQFSDDLFGNPIVARMPDGTVYVVDGQHRITALRLLGMDDIEIQCRVESEWNVPKQAEVFVRQQGTSAGIGARDAFKAKGVAGDKASMELRRALNKFGLSVGRTAGKRTVSAIGALEVAQSHGTLEETLEVITSWGEPSPERYNGSIIRAVSKLLSEKGDRLKRDRLQRAIGEFEPLRLRAEAKRHGDGGDGVYQRLLQAYNKGLGPKARL